MGFILILGNFRMTFEEALIEWKDGKKVRRKSWISEKFHLDDIIYFNKDEIVLEDIDADDWEIL